MLKRSSGILMHISSLSGEYGIGDFGKCAYDFIDFLHAAGQKLWQILPLGVTGYGDSPYQAFSAFAGNPYFIDLNEFLEKGWITKEDLSTLSEINKDEKIRYDLLYTERYKVLRKGFESFKKTKEYFEITKMISKYSKWLPDYALFMALKNSFGGVSWQEWPRAYRFRDLKTIKKAKVELKDDIEFYIFLEYLFRKQWLKLKKYANSKNIKIIGDIPIFVSTDSVDTWTNPKMFQFDKQLRPKKVAGCPPDVFSLDGQLWGNVLYNWKEIKKDGFTWWINRIRDCFYLYDIVRIDHFRGFDSYWSIPASAKTARTGKWEQGPGIELFKAIRKALGNKPIIAEDLGFLTPRVQKLLKDSGYPGMKILQFAFDGDLSNGFLPTNYTKNCVTYTGTHDNQTLIGWLETGSKEKEFCIDYLAKFLGKTKEDISSDIVYSMIETIWKSKAIFSLAQMQDFLALDDTARMNTPSILGGNWEWRMDKAALSDELILKIKKITKLYHR